MYRKDSICLKGLKVFCLIKALLTLTCPPRSLIAAVTSSCAFLWAAYALRNPALIYSVCNRLMAEIGQRLLRSN